MQDFSVLSTEVERIKSVVPAAVALINGFQSRLDQAIAAAIAANDNADLSALTEFSASLKGEADSLANAVAANTPAAEPNPEPAPSPEPAPET